MAGVAGSSTGYSWRSFAVCSFEEVDIILYGELPPAELEPGAPS
jgi:hypothetical protein